MPEEVRPVTADPIEHRPKVFVSAYACGPGDEPEAGAGWAFAKAASLRHDVWVVTRERFRPAIEAEFAANPALAEHLNVIHLDLSERIQSHLKRSWDVYWYYVLWQRALGRLAIDLHAEVGFDVAHHVTFANDWLPCGVNRLTAVPLVWGPVGGASRVPLRHLARWLGPRSTVTEIVRDISTGVARAVWGDPVARRAAVVVGQNADVAHRFRRSRRVVVEPNASFTDELPAPDEQSAGDRPRDPRPPTAIYVGRLLGWKGCRLAVATMADPLVSGWRLRMFGVGPQKAALIKLAGRLGVSERIEFVGVRPRSEVLSAYREADAMLFPSMHDQAGWAAGEASAAGCPVVCLPLGGPPIMAGPNARPVRIGRDLPHALAVALDEALRTGGVPFGRWSTRRLPALVEDWYADAMARSRRSTP